MTTRAERVAEVAALAAGGLNGLQIAKRLGISRSYAYELLSDPEGVEVRRRKASYRGVCVDCGAATDGSNGRNAPERCDCCVRREQHWRAVKRQVAAIRRFHERYGRPPSVPDFAPDQAKALGHQWRLDRFYRDGDYPQSSAVLGVFGTWNAAIRAAGFEPLAVGSYPRVPGRNGHGGGAHLEAERPSGA